MENFSRERLIERTQGLYLEAWSQYSAQKHRTRAAPVQVPAAKPSE